MIELRHSLLDPELVKQIAIDAHKLARKLKIRDYHLTPTSIIFQLVEDQNAFMTQWKKLLFWKKNEEPKS